jgi:hypothetical protein
MIGNDISIGAKEMKLTRQWLLKLIKEEIENALDNEHPSEVEPHEDAWAGGENLEQPIDHVDAVGSGASEVDDIRIADIVREELLRSKFRR